MLSISYCREVNCTYPPDKSRLKGLFWLKLGCFLLYLWYHPWYQAFYVRYRYRIGIEASDYKSISIVSVSKFQVLESISVQYRIFRPWKYQYRIGIEKNGIEGLC